MWWSWTLLQSLAIFFGPILFSKGRKLYRAARMSGPTVPLPSSTKWILDLLFVSVVAALIFSSPYFHPENIFKLTNSRLVQTSTDVVFNRLAKIREPTPADQALRSRLQSKDARLIYAAYGPAPLAECSWCSLDDSVTFMFYLLPTILWPHVAHVFVLGIATSGWCRFGSMWRTHATVAGVALAVIELYIFGISDAGFGTNSRARNEHDVMWVYWRVLTWRGIGMALVDASLALVIWLSATRRWSLGWETAKVEELVNNSYNRLEKAQAFSRATNYLKHTVCRDNELRGKAAEWWAREDVEGKLLMEDEEVAKIRIEKLSTKLDLETLRADAARKSEGLMNIVSSANAMKTEAV